MTGEPFNNPIPGAPSLQDPQGQGQGTVADQRNAALVEYWLDHARKLRSRGELQAAKLELLKAKELAPRNDDVRRQL